MTDFSMTPVSDLIGALELSDMRRFDDAALENAAERSAVGPTTSCPMTMQTYCRRIDDDVLESTGLLAGPSPTAPSLGCSTATPMCRRIGDEILESTGLSAGPQPTQMGYPGCRLPATAIMCGRIDDDALENAAEYSAVGPTTGCPMTMQTYCRRIDDDALENAAERSAVGPTTSCPPTMQTYCRRIDDGTLESLSISAGPPPTKLPPTIISTRCRHIDDGALESAAEMMA